MKNQNFLAVAILYLALGTGCTTTYTYPSSTIVAKIPFPAHQNKVDFITPNQQLDPKDYVQVGIFESSGSGNVSLDALVANLSETAQQRGADAIILLGYQNSVTGYRETFNIGSIIGTAIGNAIFKTNEPVPQEYAALSKTSASALGIKYIKNINYIDKLVKSVDIFQDTSSNYGEKIALVNNVQYSPLGSIVRQSQPTCFIFGRYIKEYSENYLINEQSDRWTYQLSNGKLSNRSLYDKDNFCIKSIDFKYTPWGAISSIVIKTSATRDDFYTEKIKYIYKDGMLAKRVITTRDNFLLEESYLYDEQSGKLLETKTYQKMPDGDKFLYSQKYSYYNNTDLADLLK